MNLEIFGVVMIAGDFVFICLLIWHFAFRKKSTSSDEDNSTAHNEGGWQFHPQHVGLIILVIVMFYWLHNYSILAP